MASINLDEKEREDLISQRFNQIKLHEGERVGFSVRLLHFEDGHLFMLSWSIFISLSLGVSTGDFY